MVAVARQRGTVGSQTGPIAGDLQGARSTGARAYSSGSHLHLLRLHARDLSVPRDSLALVARVARLRLDPEVAQLEVLLIHPEVGVVLETPIHVERVGISLDTAQRDLRRVQGDSIDAFTSKLTDLNLHRSNVAITAALCPTKISHRLAASRLLGLANCATDTLEEIRWTVNCSLAALTRIRS